MAKNIVDAEGEPVDKAALLEETTGPTPTGVRSILPTWNSRGITPELMAAALREAESPGSGSSRNYLELAERMEESYLHYNGVLGTRKRSLSGIPIRAEPADDSAEAAKDAELAQAVCDMDILQDSLFNILDAIGKGFSVTEIIWDMSESQWMPKALEYRLPQWFDYDRIDGKTLRVRSDTSEANQGTNSSFANAAGWPRLLPFKTIVHQVQAKSGLPIRGGLARVAAWGYLFHAFSMKDWVRFVEAYGMPLRLGKYDKSATKADQDVLWRAVRNISGDAAAIVPASMEIEFITDESSTARSEIFRDLLNYVDSQISIATVGQTLTTQMGDSGSYAAANVHNVVREDIEESDGRSLSATLKKYLIIPLIKLNHGERKAYPKIYIKRERVAEIQAFSKSVSDLVKVGLRVSQEEVRTHLGLKTPADGDEILIVPSTSMPDEPDEPIDADKKGQTKASLARSDPRADPEDDPIGTALISALNAIDNKDWVVLSTPALQPILDMAIAEPEQLMSNLFALYPEMNLDSLQEQLAQILFVADSLERLNANA